MSIFHATYSRLIPKLQALRGGLWHWSLEDRASGRRMEAFGSRHACATYRQRFFDRDAAVTRRLQLHMRGAHHAIRRAHARSGLVVVNGLSLPAELGRSALTVPRFVGVTTKLPATVEAFRASLGSSAREDLRRIRVHGYEARFERDPAWVDTFCSRYHLPSMRRRHGDRTIVHSRSQMRACLRADGEFVQVWAGDRCIAAGLQRRSGNWLSLHCLGWIDGDEAWTRKRCVAAIYWFRVQRAFELGCTELDFGGSPPFAESGLVEYKAKWGGKVDAARTRGPMDLLLVNQACAGGSELLAKHSFFVRQPDGSLMAHEAEKATRAAGPTEASCGEKLSDPAKPVR